ncbi:MAG: SLBB domain-containing protein [Maritimibacter sp.]|nr:SLBB domain-containing protein [Maritimibacter sp.]
MFRSSNQFYRMTVFSRFFCFAVALLLAHAALAEDYVFVAGDRVLIRAGRWDHTTFRFEYWDGVSGEYSLSANGDIHVPLAGTVRALGETADSLSAAVTLQIQRRIGLTDPPEVAIEIAGHAPIYVSGAVNTPGAFPFRLGMTVRQALALAGGLGSASASEDGAERELIRYSGQIAVLLQQLAALEAEEARLENEVAAIEARANGAAAPDEPGELEGIQLELFRARQRSIGTREENIKELQDLVAEQVRRLDEQIVLVESQVETARDDAGVVEDLTQRGLAVRSRMSSAEITLANFEAQLVRLEVARLEAVQQLNLARRDEITLFDEARLGRLASLRDVRLDLATTRAELRTARALNAEAAARSAAGSVLDAVAEVSYVVTRDDPSGIRRIEADLDTRLRPRDTIEVSVEMLPPDSSN